MQSRMKKYYEKSNENINNKVEKDFTPSEGSSRTKRNQNLYKEVSNLELEDFDLNSNAQVLGDNPKNIDINDIKGIIEEKYPEKKKNKSFGDVDNTVESTLGEIHLDETREYDINSIIKDVKSKKEVNYEEDRLKKVHDSQMEILKDLESLSSKKDNNSTNEKPGKKKSKKNNQEQTLMDLIDTITAKELVSKEEIEKKDEEETSGELDPLDILQDLRGDDENTKVMGVLNEETINEAEMTKKFEDFIYGAENDNPEEDMNTLDLAISERRRKNSQSKEKEAANEDENPTNYYTTADLGNIMDTKTLEIEKSETKELDKSFVTNTSNFTQSDFDDFNDLKDDMRSTKIIIKILMVIIVIVFIVGCIFFINNYFNLGLF